MKTALILLTTTLLTACQPGLPPVPDNGRRVVEPSGTTSSVKSWSGPTRQENDAILPFGTERR